MFSRGMIEVFMSAGHVEVGIVIDATPDMISLIYEDDWMTIVYVPVCIIDVNECSCDMFLSTEAERIW